MKPFHKVLTELGKVRISLPVALSALAGYVLYSGKIDAQGLILALGVFFMSCGSGALNHWQERKTDAKMPRTQTRPIPSGRITSMQGFMIVAGYLVTGSFILIISNPPIALYLSWATLFFYNLVYTPLKKVSAFAVIPGSMVGALPPIIGWSAAGGYLFSESILIVGTFFFIGQIPHFWLLLFLFGDQYKLAGLPSLTDIFSDLQIKRVTFAWILATIASALLVIVFVFQAWVLIILMLAYILYLMATLTGEMLVKNEFNALPAFYKLNFLYLFMMFFLIAEGLLR
ncbi:MAG TPA: protoheme IX farnesyltransferase [Mariniphaga sp.]|nr:protoheme IX farnesyltransferase [Mariniphaga sp.]